MSNRNEVLKKRYQVYRRLGYDSATSRALSFRSLDVSQLEISKKTGKLKRNTTTKQFIETDMKEWKNTQVIDRYNAKIVNIENDTVYTRHGMFTHDNRYKGENGKIISILRHQTRKVKDQKTGKWKTERVHLSTNQAYYFWYTMTQNNMSYKETQRQLLSNSEFEEYDKSKRARPRRSRRGR